MSQENEVPQLGTSDSSGGLTLDGISITILYFGIPECYNTSARIGIGLNFVKSRVYLVPDNFTDINPIVR